MSVAAILFTLWFAPPARANRYCAAIEAEIRACMAPPLLDLARTTGDPESIAFAFQQVSRMRASEGHFLPCAYRYEAYRSACNDPSEGRVLSAEWAQNIVDRVRIQTVLLNKIQFSISVANVHAGFERYALTCFNHATVSYLYPLCFIVDRKTTSYIHRPEVAADDLPLTVGASEDCSFFVDANRIFTADHCGRSHLAHAWPFGSPEVATKFRASLPYVNSAYVHGGAFEDLAVFSIVTPVRPMGKPVYHLALDPSLARDCELRGDILACSDASLQVLNEVAAESLSFPMPADRMVVGPRDRPQSVMHSQGQIFYESALRRFYFHANAQWGSSGAPVYFAAGARVGGLILDRPLVLGVISGAVHPSSTSTSDFSTAIMGVVGVVTYRRLLPLVGEGREQYATGTNP